MIEEVGRIPRQLEHASHTGVSETIQVGLSGNLGECFSIQIVSHRTVVELQYALHNETRGRLQPLHYSVGTEGEK